MASHRCSTTWLPVSLYPFPHFFQFHSVCYCPLFELQLWGFGNLVWQIPGTRGVGGGVFAWQFLFIPQGRRTALFSSPQDRMSFHRALWPFIYFTHFSHKNIYFQKNSRRPPPQYSNSGPSLCNHVALLAKVPLVLVLIILSVYENTSLGIPRVGGGYILCLIWRLSLQRSKYGTCFD